MRVKVDGKVLRGLIREILEDSENILPGITGELSGDYPEPPDPPITADPVANFQDLGPDVSAQMSKILRTYPKLLKSLKLQLQSLFHELLLQW